MEDGSGKCLLDVISDPSALNEFLNKTNSQLLADGNTGTYKTQTFQGTIGPSQLQTSRPINTIPSLSNATTMQNFRSQSSLVPGSTVQHVANSKPAVSVVNTSISQTMVRSVNGSVSNSPRITAVNSKSNSPINNLVNVTKGIAMSPVTYQGKKPIPIQPKNAVILPNTSIQSGVNVLGNVHHGLVSQTPTSLMSNQIHTGVLPRASSINGLDTSKSRTTPIQSRTVQPTILATPPKRIAPKQVLSPPTNTPLATMPSPVRIQQANLQNKQNIQLATQLIQGQPVQGSSTLFPQQRTAGVRPIINSHQGTSIIQSSSASNHSTAQPVQQIQQLINDKLSGQPSQPTVTGQVQQKVFSQAQLQTALKQSQLIAQNSPGQQQNILVQQQILKQLIQQAQQIQQQKQSDKTTTSINVQPISANTQGVVQLHPQQVKLAGPQQVTIRNQIPGSNQIQMVLPNQQVLKLTQNTLPSNQQTINVAQNVTHVSAANLNQNIKTNSQPMIIVSQSGGNFVFQNLQQSNTGITTSAATTVPLQNLLNQQQKQIQRQLTTNSIQQQPMQQQVKVAGNTILQVGQPKQMGQQTVFVQNRAVQGQNASNVKPVVSQPNLVIQAKPTTQVNTTIQQLTPAQLQQLQSMGGVQKVLIIKQPEVLQKLANAQGGKAPQAIQITQQQLQVLQQMQNPQTSTAQKIIIQSKGDGSSPSTTILTAQQLKQLQQSLQQQAGNTKIVQIPQRQTLVQQIQQHKTPSKMAHVPRILQTSGRQATNQASSKSTTIKQEPNRGVKRPHTETPEPPKVVRRLKNALYQDQQAVLHPDIHNPFQSKLDGINKLRNYHVYHDPGQTPSEIQKSELLFETVSNQLIKKSEKMMEKYRSLILAESTRREPSSEMVMLYRLYLADERANLAQNKRQLAEELKSLKSVPQVSMPPPATTTVANTTTHIEKTTVTPESTITKTHTPPTTIEDMDTDKELDILNADTLLATPEDHSLLCNDDDEEDDEEDEDGSDIELEANEIDKAVFNMETSSSYYKPVNHLSDSLMDSPSTPHNDGDDSGDDLLVDDDDDAEKEDVTATLALLHSMAEELDGTIS